MALQNSTIDPTNFTDSDAFNDSSSLYIKEIHVDELQNAIARLRTYLPNVDNCTGLICQSCQNVCVNCSNTNQSCQTASVCQSNCGNQSCQNGCYCQSYGNQSCQNACYCQSCQGYAR